MAVVVPIISTFDNKGIRGAMREFDRAKTGTDKVAASMKLMGAAFATAGIAAAGLAIKLGTDGVKAALDDQAAMVKLNTTLSNMGFGEQTAAVGTWIDELQRSSAVSEEQLRPALDRLVRATGDLTTAQDTLKLALDVSAGSGKSLEAVSNALGKAYEGNFGALGKLGLGIDKATLKSGDLNDITKILAGTFAGQADAAANTLQGSLTKVQIAAGEVQEAFGYGFIDGIDGATGAADDLAAAMKDLEPLMYDLGKTAGSTATDLTKTAASAYKLLKEPQWPSLIEHVQNTVLALDNANIVMKNLPGPMGRVVSNLWDLAAAWAGAGDAARDAAAAQAAASSAPAEYFGGTPTAGYTPQYVAGATRNYLDYLKRLEDAKKKARRTYGGGSSGGTAAEIEGELPKLKKSLEAYGRAITQALGAGVEAGGNPLLATVDGLMGRVVKTAQKWGVNKQWVSDLEDTFGQAKDAISTALTDAQNALDAAQTAVDEWAKSTSDALYSAFDFTGLFESSLDKDGKLVGGKLTEGFSKAIAEFQWFSNVISAINAQPGGEALAQFLMSQGIQKGGTWGQALIDQGLVPSIAAQFNDVKRISDTTAQGMVPSYLKGGVDSAQATYDGLKAALGKDGPVYKAVMNLMDNLASAMNRTATITVRTVYEGGSSNFTVPGVKKVNASEVLASATPAPITVNVTGAVDPVGTARQIRRILNRGELRVGTGF